MSYIYHLKPEPFEGKSLIPLNQMDKASQVYKTQSKKYLGRESLMEQNIPLLNCKWNDVVHFSSLDPQIIINKLKEFETDLKILRPFYFKIPIKNIIEKYDAVVFDRKKGVKGDFTIKEHEIGALCETSFQELYQVPDETINFWNYIKENGGKFLWFPFVPHVLIKGKVETSHFEICELKL